MESNTVYFLVTAEDEITQEEAEQIERWLDEFTRVNPDRT